MKFDKTIYLIARIKSKADRFLMVELEKYGLTGLAPSHGEIIGALLTHGQLPMTQLAEMIDRDKSTVTALVNKLIELGYVAKKKDPADQRISMIFLTAQGLALKPAFLRISDELISKTYQGISPEDRVTIIKVLKKMNRNF